VRLVASATFTGAEWAVQVKVGVCDIDDIVNGFSIRSFDFLVVAC